MLEPPALSQVVAWQDCYSILQKAFAHPTDISPESDNWTLVFEYELPRERGRRPDVVVLADKTIIVLEFKGFAYPDTAFIDQVDAYARDLHHYHAASHEYPVIPVLVLTESKEPLQKVDNVWVVGPDDLPELISTLVEPRYGSPIDSAAWIAADYEPLPSLVTAARMLFENEPLPQIKRAQSAGVPDTIAALAAIGEQAIAQHEMHLALVCGVPGAGKTLVGLQLAYNYYAGESRGDRSAVFLSGNGPLVKVLQHALKNSVFVQDVHGFLKQYGGDKDRLPKEHIWIYDEAQRAWDAERVREKRGHATSEPEDFVRLGERKETGAFLVGLIGEGQEIHLGEEAGLGQWNEAIRRSNQPWVVHCPSHVAGVFKAASRVEASEHLNLTVSLRTHLAEDLQTWVTQLLDGQIDAARETSKRVLAKGFDMYVTRDLDAAVNYVRRRYEGQLDKRFGLLASSKAKNLSQYGIMNDYNYTKNMKEGPWYNDPPDSRFSCCQLRDVATEFSCQGLELDFPIIAWGDDVWWTGRAWASRPQPRSKAHDPHRLRINSYRVLLTRGRDGFVVFVPPETVHDRTYLGLTMAGTSPLRSPIVVMSVST
jgi:hypothetical protein